MCIIHRGILGSMRRTHELMLAFYHRNDPGRSEYDSDLNSWLEQVIDNPVQIESESKYPAKSIHTLARSWAKDCCRVWYWSRRWR